jgi:hypothetical protein
MITAKDLCAPAKVIWVINQDTARQWYDLLEANIPFTNQEHADLVLLETIKAGNFQIIYDEPMPHEDPHQTELEVI